MTIDNGNHLLLSGNHAALGYLRTLGAEHRLVGPAAARSFRSSISRAASSGRCASMMAAFPWWIFSRSATGAGHARARLSADGAAAVGRPHDKSVGEVIRFSGHALRAAGAAAAARGAQHRPGGRLGAARRRRDPRDACGRRTGLPAADRARRLGRGADRAGAGIPRAAQCRRAVSGISCTRCALPAAGRCARFRRRDHRACRRRTSSILAVPPYAASSIVPGLKTPTEFRAIVNAHFRIEPPADAAADPRRAQRDDANGCSRFPGRLSVTISAADRLIDAPREALAQKIWSEVAASPGCRRRCRPGRSCASAAPPSPRPSSRTPPAGRQDRLQQSVPGRRLDKYRLARHDRKCHPIRPARRRTSSAPSRSTPQQRG